MTQFSRKLSATSSGIPLSNKRSSISSTEKPLTAIAFGLLGDRSQLVSRGGKIVGVVVQGRGARVRFRTAALQFAQCARAARPRPAARPAR